MKIPRKIDMDRKRFIKHQRKVVFDAKLYRMRTKTRTEYWRIKKL